MVQLGELGGDSISDLEDSPVQEVREESQAEEVTQEAEEPDDYKTLYEQAQAQLDRERVAREKNEQDQRSRDIQLVKQRQKDAMSAETNKLVASIAKRLNVGEIDDYDIAAAVETGVNEIYNAADVVNVKEDMRSQMVAMQAQLKEEGKTLGLGEELDDPRAENVTAMWNEAVQAYQEGKFDIAEVRRRDTLRELDIVKKSLSSPRKTGMSLNERTPASGGGQSDQATWDAFGRGEIKWSKRVVEAGKRLDYL